MASCESWLGLRQRIELTIAQRNLIALLPSCSQGVAGGLGLCGKEIGYCQSLVFLSFRMPNFGMRWQNWIWGLRSEITNVCIAFQLLLLSPFIFVHARRIRIHPIFIFTLVFHSEFGRTLNYLNTSKSDFAALISFLFDATRSQEFHLGWIESLKVEMTHGTAT